MSFTKSDTDKSGTSSIHVILSRQWEAIAKAQRPAQCFKGFRWLIPLSHFVNPVRFLWNFHSNTSHYCLTVIQNWINTASWWWQWYVRHFEMFHWKCYHSRAEYKLSDSTNSHIFDGLIWIINSYKKVANGFFVQLICMATFHSRDFVQCNHSIII